MNLYNLCTFSLFRCLRMACGSLAISLTAFMTSMSSNNCTISGLLSTCRTITSMHKSAKHVQHKLKSIQKPAGANSIALLSRLLVNFKVPHVKWPCYPLLLGEHLDVYGTFETLNCTALLADLKLQSETIHKPFTIAEIGVIHDRQDSLLLHTNVVRAMVSLKSSTQLGSSSRG
jgi:hypothetical protein